MSDPVKPPVFEATRGESDAVTQDLADAALADAAPPEDTLAPALIAAQTGLRSQVAALITALAEVELLIPLASDVANVREGEATPLSQDIALAPHLLLDPDGGLHCALFSDAAVLDALGEQLGWQTDGDALKYCAISAKVALAMALDVIDERRVLGLVFNPGHASELVLTRSELASIVQGQALPLVGYVSQIPDGPAEQTLVATPGEAFPQAFLDRLEACLRASPEVTAHRLERSFNSERDLEPHPTLVLSVRASEAERRTLAERVIEAIRDQLPPPGYIDILFDG